MTKFLMKIDNEYEVEAENEESAYEILEERFAMENQTAENEFWDSIIVTKIGDNENAE